MKVTKKLLVCFPGLGYHCDKPLLYYGRKTAKETGFDCEICLHYTYQGDSIRGDAEKIREAETQLYLQAVEQLKDIRWNEWEEILFLSKSIGTVIACRIAQEYNVQCKHVLYTPLEDAFTYLNRRAVAFIGTEDSWSSAKNIVDQSLQSSVICKVYTKANHSLEFGNCQKDIGILEDVILTTKRFVEDQIF